MKKLTGKIDSEQGLTLIEMIVAMAMTVVIMGSAVALITSALNDQPELSVRADQVTTANTAIAKLVQEIRQGVIGSVTTGLPSNKLEFESYVDGTCGTTTVTTATKCKVAYKCESEKCTRTTGTGTTSTTTVVTGVKNTDNFEYVKGTSPCSSVSGEPATFVTVKLELRSNKGGVTTLSDGAGLRSCP